MLSNDMRQALFEMISLESVLTEEVLCLDDARKRNRDFPMERLTKDMGMELVLSASEKEEVWEAASCFAYDMARIGFLRGVERGMQISQLTFSGSLAMTLMELGAF